MKKLKVYLLLLLPALIAGCAHIVPIEPKRTELPAVPKIPKTAALVCDRVLTDFKYEMKLMGDTWVYPFGPALKETARNIAKNNFESVTEYSSLDAALQGPESIVLIPRGTKAESSTAVFAWNKARLTLVVEWTAKDRASHNTVWLKTVVAESSETAGNAFTGAKHQRIQVQKLFDDLSIKSQEAVQEAKELR